MKAKYLTIAGENINVGDTYFMVSKHSDFPLTKQKASTENNVSYACYFKTEAEAKHYKYLLELHEFAAIQIKKIEKNHLNK